MKNRNKGPRFLNQVPTLDLKPRNPKAHRPNPTAQPSKPSTTALSPKLNDTKIESHGPPCGNHGGILCACYTDAFVYIPCHTMPFHTTRTIHTLPSYLHPHIHTYIHTCIRT